MFDHESCQICRHGTAQERPGRLGRYAQTCDRCESRRGATLVSSALGYEGR